MDLQYQDLQSSDQEQYQIGQQVFEHHNYGAKQYGKLYTQPSLASPSNKYIPTQYNSQSTYKQTIQQKMLKKQQQILAKLQHQNINSPSQYKKIIDKLISQKITLKSDLQLLRQKVQLLKIKQVRKLKEIKRQENIKYYPQKQYYNLKQQLKKKYDELNKWRRKSNKKQMKFAVQIQYQQIANKLIELQSQMEEVLVKYKIEKRMNKNLSKQLKLMVSQSTVSSSQIQQIQEFNKELKTKIFLIKKITKNQQQSQIDIYSYKIEMKERQKKVNQLMRYEMLSKRLNPSSLQKSHYPVNQPQVVQEQVHRMGYDPKGQISSSQSNYQKPLKLRSKTQTSMEIRRKLSQKQIQFQNIFKGSTVQNTPYLTFMSLSKQQINQLSNHFRVQSKRVQSLSSQLQGRIQSLIKHVDPNHKRQNSKMIISKQKDMAFTKNRILVQEMINVFKRKIKILGEYNIYQKYYGAIQKPQIFQPHNVVRQKTQSDYVKKNQQNKLLSNGDQDQQQNLKQQKVQQNITPAQYSQNIVQTQFYQFFKKMLNNGSKRKQKQEFTKLEKQKQKQKQKKKKQQVSLNSKNFDFVGQLDTDIYEFDDTIYSDIGQMYINQLTIYHSKKGIHQIKAKYKLINALSKIQTKKQNHDYQYFVETQLSYKVTQAILTQLKNSKQITVSTTQLSINDYIKEIKVFYNCKQNYVSKIQLLSKYHVKYQYGDQTLSFPTKLIPYLNVQMKQEKSKRRHQSKEKGKGRGESKQSKAQKNDKLVNKFYPFEINSKEYPSFLMGNYTQVDGKIMLGGFGMLINKEQQ